MPPGDDEFDRPPPPQEQDAAAGYDRDLARAEADRGAPNALVSIAYWLVRGVQAMFGLVTRRS
jgi:hypothetical protein